MPSIEVINVVCSLISYVMKDSWEYMNKGCQKRLRGYVGIVVIFLRRQRTFHSYV